ncbi:MAG: hypothetical protein AAF327_17330 [Cyanobacteria bacterium P01_A01_bin.37]
MIIFIIDASVIFHLINSRLQQYALSHEDKELYVKASLLWINALGMLPYFAGADGCKAIWVMDSKPYWRSQYYSEYKANRTSKPDVNYVRQVFDSLQLLSIEVESYEADDLAALFCVLFKKRSLRSQWSQLYLLTVDTDWQGLIEEGITWVDVNRHEPVVRDVPRVYTWFEKKHGAQPKKWQKCYELPHAKDFHPTDIWKWKAIVGDKSDNLPPGCDYHLINLYEPHSEHTLWMRQDVVREAKVLIKKPVVCRYLHKEMTTILNGLGISMPLSYIVT